MYQKIIKNYSRGSKKDNDSQVFKTFVCKIFNMLDFFSNNFLLLQGVLGTIPPDQMQVSHIQFFLQ